MIFSPEEIAQIEELADCNKLIGRMWAELNKVESDPIARFQKSLTDAVNALSVELDSVHTGKFNHFKILNSDSQTYKRIFQLLANSKNIIDGLKRSSDLKGPVVSEAHNEVMSTVAKIPKETKSQETEAAMSFTDRQAEIQKQKK